VAIALQAPPFHSGRYIRLYQKDKRAIGGEKMKINLAKHKLVKVWMKRKTEIDRKIIKENVATDEQFEPYIVQLFTEIGPLWFQAFRFDHPDQEYNHWNLKCWIEENEHECRQKGDTNKALIWVQMYNYFITLLEMELIPRDPYEPINIAHS
jgi:hypothetical protein